MAWYDELQRRSTTGEIAVALYDAGTARLDFGASRKYGAALRRAAAAHRRVVVHVTVNDWAGNKHIYDRAVRLAL